MNTENAIKDLVKKHSTRKKKIKISSKAEAIKEAEANYGLATTQQEKKQWFDIILKLKGWDKLSKKDDDLALKEKDKQYLIKIRQFYVDLMKEKQ